MFVFTGNGDPFKPCKGSNKPGGGGGSGQQQPHHPQVTSSADEFVWIDSYNRLVELQKLPWTHTDLCKVRILKVISERHRLNILTNLLTWHLKAYILSLISMNLKGFKKLISY